MITTRAFILRSVDYGEADRILTLYTRDLGRVSAMARSARRSRKRFGGALEPFAEFEAVLMPPRIGTLRRISEATLVNAHPGLCADYGRLDSASRMVLMLRDATHDEEADPEIFDLLVCALSLLEEKSPDRPETVVLAFGLKLMARCGFSFSADGCVACGAVVPRGRSAFFDPVRGGLVCTACGGGPILLDAAAVLGFQQLSARPMGAFGDGAFSEETTSIMTRTFESFLKCHLPGADSRKIRSR